MKLVPNMSDPEKWVKFYQAMAAGKLKPSNHNIQHGRGRSMGARRADPGYMVVEDKVEPMVVSPTEMAKKQAQSEVNHQRQQGHGGTLEARRHARNYVSGRDTVEPANVPLKAARKRKPSSPTANPQRGHSITKVAKRGRFF